MANAETARAINPDRLSTSNRGYEPLLQIRGFFRNIRIAPAKTARETESANVLMKAFARSGINRQTAPAIIGPAIDRTSGL